MSGNSRSVDSRTAFEQLTQVGEARSQQLTEAGFETWSDVAEADVSELEQILDNAGATTAGRIKGSAQGHELSDVEEPTYDVLQELEQVGAHRSQQLRDAGLETIQDVADSTPTDIADTLTMGNLSGWVAKQIFSSAHQMMDDDADGGDDDPSSRTEIVNVKQAGRDGVTMVDRSTRFGNPFQLEKDGGKYTREESVEKYAEHFYEKIQEDEGFRQAVHELKGETLGCWCKPKSCHGDVIVDYLENRARDDVDGSDDDDGTQVPDTQADVDPDVEGSVVICGSRGLPANIMDEDAVVELVDNAIDESGFEVTEVLSGGASGGDYAGEIWADANDIPVRTFEPNWDDYPDMAGFRRNREMVAQCDAVLALWDGESSGTADTIGRGLEEYGQERVYVHRYQAETGYYPTSDSFADQVVDLDDEQDDSSDDDDDRMSGSSSSPDFSATPGWEDAPRGGKVAIVGAAQYTDEERKDGLPDETTLFKHMDRAKATGMIDRALTRFGLCPDVYATTAQDDMGAVQVKAWGRGHAESGVWEDEEWAEKKMEFNVDDFTELNTDEDGNVDWAAAFADRDRAMMGWADWVVVVQDGGYVFSTLNKIPDQGSAVVKRYTKLGDDSWEPDEDHRGVGPDIPALQTKHGETDPLKENPADHADEQYAEFQQYQGSASEKYEGEGEGTGSGGNFIH